MFRIRRVSDHLTAANAVAVAEAQAILRQQFAGLDEEEIAKLPMQLADPFHFRFVSRLFVAEGRNDRMLGLAHLLHASDIGFCYLEIISTAKALTGGGVGAALYERVREEAMALGASGLYFECLPDDPELSPNAEVRAINARRLKFYERFGARPIAGTAYETPLSPGDHDPPYLVFDGLGRSELPSKASAQKIVRAILERKYGHLTPPGYIDMVVKSFKDDPIVLRAPRYIKKLDEVVLTPRSAEGVLLVVNDLHDIHHVHDSGYVEAPVRLRAILAAFAKSNLFDTVPARHFPDRVIREVHDGRLLDYIQRASKLAGEKKSIYPYVFPLRNAARAPKDETVLAGYFCIDTFTPLNLKAYLAARHAVDCAMTAAEAVVGGRHLAYALVRPPGHHAERRAFGGFCYFNNAAIAAHYMSRYGRIAILDVDYHHGNGQQDIFYDRSDVLTVSVHGHPSFAYPYFSGFRDETGLDAGAGYNLNLPLAEKTTSADHLAAVERGLARILRHRPEFLVVALGLDTAQGDPTGTWENRAADFERLGEKIGQQGYPTLVVQEGGYKVRTLGTNALAFFKGLVKGAGVARGRGLVKTRQRKAPSGPLWRSAPRRADVEKVRALVAATGFFNSEEQAVAAELVSERVARGAASGYEFILCDDGEGHILGYACYGPVFGAPGRFDLYWIAVDPGRQRAGLGRDILARAEAAMKKAGAQRIYIDTSGRALYDPTRAFYKAQGYKRAAELKDFYGPGDAKVILAKDLV